MAEMTMPVWKHPEYYAGFSPDGDYVLYARHRDSSILDNSNFECLKEHLMKAVKDPNLGEAPPRKDPSDWYDIPEGWIYDWSASCWAHGWREYLMVRADAPEELLKVAQEIHDDLTNNYPVFNDDDYSHRQDEAICEFWGRMSISERVYLCQKAEVSVFTARHEEIPVEVYDYWYDSGEFA